MAKYLAVMLIMYHTLTIRCTLVLRYCNKRIARHEDPSKSCVHFLSSHFFTQLKSQGVDAIARWTSNIDVFTKKIIFVPVCEDNHWSLCSVVNPGSILNVQNIKESETKKVVSLLCFCCSLCDLVAFNTAIFSLIFTAVLE